MSPLVDTYIDNLSDTQQAITENVRRLLFNLVPGIHHYFGMFCYINAIPNGIDLGLCRGKDLTEEFPSLELKGRAIVASVSLYSVKDIKQKEVREIIIAAALWNEEAKKKKIPMVKSRKL